jgi:hypothetical protein
MKTENGKATAKVVYGQKQKTPLAYEWTYNAFETIDEVKAADLLMTDDETIKFRNDQREGKARSAAFVAAAEAAQIVKPTAENSGHIRLKDALRNALACKLKDGTTPKYTEQQARDLAEQVTGESWSDFENE